MSEGTPELTTVPAVPGAEPGVAGESKKRKRTGKDRKEAKALAEQVSYAHRFEDRLKLIW